MVYRFWSLHSLLSAFTRPSCSREQHHHRNGRVGPDELIG
jgi:hypothetical protein